MTTEIKESILISCQWCDNVVTGDKKARVLQGRPCLQTDDCRVLWKEHSSVERAKREAYNEETRKFAEAKAERKKAKNARRAGPAIRAAKSQEHARNHPKGSH